MKPKIWKFLVFTVLTLCIGSFLFLFKENKVDPTLAKIPFAFWTGFLITVLIVGLTFLASRFSHIKNREKDDRLAYFLFRTLLSFSWLRFLQVI